MGEVFKYLETQGFEIITIGVDKEGYVNLEALETAVDEDTILVSIMHVNNEIGTIQPISEIGKIIKSKNPETLFHVDAVQSFGKIPIHVKKSKIDFLSISAHKFYGPRGIGLLYKNKQVRMKQLLWGGGQQKNFRSGTENIPGVAGTLNAAQYVFKEQETILNHMSVCKKTLAEGLLNALSDVWINGPRVDAGAPYILNVGFKDVRAEVLLHALEQEGIFVSSGSACSSHKKVKEGVLVALGLSNDCLDNAIRFSFAHDTSLEDIEEVIQIVKSQVTLLRRYTPGGRKK